jgi:hypothetical protein
VPLPSTGLSTALLLAQREGRRGQGLQAFSELRICAGLVGAPDDVGEVGHAEVDGVASGGESVELGEFLAGAGEADLPGTPAPRRAADPVRRTRRLALHPFITNTRVRAFQWLEACHRAHARVEDRICCAKDTGRRQLPSREFAINRVSYTLTAIATDPIAWLQILTLTGDLARCELKTLRYGVLHTAARLVDEQRRRSPNTADI